MERLARTRLADVLGLSSDEAENLADLVLLHQVLDIALATLVATALTDTPELRDGVLEAVSGLLFDRRLTLARAAGLLPEEHAAAIRTVNTARNRLVHFQPGRPFSESKGSLANAEFERLMDGGLAALRYLRAR